MKQGYALYIFLYSYVSVIADLGASDNGIYVKR